ncbi:helix-turn-helix domain-containing protein [Bremerella sp. T1]|uniref:helix-turn-helix domain-containing protein n=1 Tax=Bremerella sp. TYQ1 TaxID=3119568 RepID=UPI001CCB1C3A|nr:helix-turn-helix domain-containing protein [Bremerella volcania]UBM37366.1 helix-turn-helix domain-containing protein [Bremerella volcania]
MASDRLKSLTGSAAKVYLFLAKMANGETGQCWPSHKTIAKATSMSERSVRYALTELTVAKLIKMKNRGRNSSLYEMLYPATDCQLRGGLSGTTLPDDALTGNLEHFNRQPVAYEPTSRTNNRRSGGDRQGYTPASKEAKKIYREMESVLGFGLDPEFLKAAQEAEQNDRVLGMVVDILDELEKSGNGRGKTGLFLSKYRKGLEVIQATELEVQHDA